MRPPVHRWPSRERAPWPPQGDGWCGVRTRRAQRSMQPFRRGAEPLGIDAIFGLRLGTKGAPSMCTTFGHGVTSGATPPLARRLCPARTFRLARDPEDLRPRASAPGRALEAVEFASAPFRG
jgi:hypothetical protein